MKQINVQVAQELIRRSAADALKAAAISGCENYPEGFSEAIVALTMIKAQSVVARVAADMAEINTALEQALSIAKDSQARSLSAHAWWIANGGNILRTLMAVDVSALRFLAGDLLSAAEAVATTPGTDRSPTDHNPTQAKERRKP